MSISHAYDDSVLRGRSAERVRPAPREPLHRPALLSPPTSKNPAISGIVKNGRISPTLRLKRPDHVAVARRHHQKRVRNAARAVQQLRNALRGVGAEKQRLDSRGDIEKGADLVPEKAKKGGRNDWTRRNAVMKLQMGPVQVQFFFEFDGSFVLIGGSFIRFIPFFGRYFHILLLQFSNGFPTFSSFSNFTLGFPGFPIFQGVGQNDPLIPAVLVQQGGEGVFGRVLPAGARLEPGQLGAQRVGEAFDSEIGRAEQARKQRIDLLQQRRELQEVGLPGPQQGERPRGQRSENLG